MTVQKTTRRPPRWLKIILAVGALGASVVCLGLAILIFYPQAAAKNIDHLRDIIGDAPVAQLETAVLNIQDRLQQWEFQLGLRKPAAPWSESPPTATAIQPTSISVTAAPPSVNTLIPSPSSATPAPSSLPEQTATTPISAPSRWQPSSLTPLGTLPGEGQWTPYLQSPDGRIVAYRTFLQADPKRPYATAAIVAFDLAATRLHFVLGTIEPLPATPEPSRTGAIPSVDLHPGVLLATFNGGFKARHGYYGAMVDGVIAQPATSGLATVAIYADGHVQMGNWGQDIKDTPALLAWRQNGVLLIYKGKINPATALTTAVWGLTLKGEAITWRSALGLSADGQTLYYVAGEQLDVATLTKVVAQAGAAEALQLDVNNYWVHFTAIRSAGSSLIAEPLLSDMKDDVDRYLKHSERDFFYVTVATQP